MIQATLMLLIVGLLVGCGESSGGSQESIDANNTPDKIITSADIPPVPQIPED